MRSGFVAIVGRPNVGKSTLINTIIGEKVTITSSRPNTTRHQIRGVLTQDELQLVFVDTPGIHRPKTRLGERLNESALAAVDGVDVLIPLIEASATIGPGDRNVLSRCLAAAGAEGGPTLIVAVNKMDKAGPARTAGQLMAALSEVEALGATLGFILVSSVVLSLLRAYQKNGETRKATRPTPDQRGGEGDDVPPEPRGARATAQGA